MSTLKTEAVSLLQGLPDNCTLEDVYRRLRHVDKTWSGREAGPSRNDLKASADLYAEVYSTDEDLRALTEAAISGWPE
jgi:hypothetical protein